MSSTLRPSGIRVTLPDALARSTTASTSRARSSGPRRPAAIPVRAAASTSAAESDAIAAALREQDLTVVDTVDVPAVPPDATARRGAPLEMRLDVPLGADEAAVVLVEQDGVYTWQFAAPPPASAASTASRKRGTSTGGAREARFQLRLAPAGAVPAEARARRRGLLTDVVAGAARAIVFKFAGRFLLGRTTTFLERHVQPGVVVMRGPNPLDWPLVRDFAAVDLPPDRPARVLLFVHGTFSSTKGGYGGLCATPWGLSFLERAASRYDAVVGFDHPTLSVDPRANATDLLRALEARAWRQPVDIDVICHSRGAITLRSLTEHLLPAVALPLRIGRVIFVGGVNGGTLLAAPENWRVLIDLYTNLAVGATRAMALFPSAAFASGLLRELLKSVGVLAKSLVATGLEDNAIPGLAAMNPSGPFITELNRTQPGQPAAADCAYYAITSDFEPKLGLDQPGGLSAQFLQLAADGFVDRLMQDVANDLVVNTDSMIAIDRHAGAFIKDILAFGTNGIVYHTNYFLQPKVTDALASWLGLSAPAMPGPTPRSRVVRRRIAKTLLKSIAASRFQPKTEQPADLADLVALANLAVATLREPPKMSTEVSASADPELPPARFVRRGRFRPMTPAPAREESEVEAFEAADGDAPSEAPVRRSVTRSPRPALSAAADGPLTPAPSPAGLVTCHFLAEMDDQVEVEKPVSVDVRISRAKLEALRGAAVQDSAAVAEDRLLIVEMIPKRNFRNAGEKTREEVPVPAAGREESVVFDVAGTNVGDGEIWIRLRQGSQPLAMLKLSCRIVKKIKGAPQRGAVRAAVEPLATMPAPLHQLIIHEIERGNDRVYWFTLDSPQLGWKTDYESKPFTGDRLAYVATLYQKIEEAWLSVKRDFDKFDLKLKARGSELCRELFPPELHDELWAKRDHVESILVFSEEPFIPWESVYLHDRLDRPAAGGRFLAEMGLVRWQHGLKGYPPDVLHARPGRCRYVIPKYQLDELKLAEAEKEIRFLTDEFGATPVGPNFAEVCKVLAGPGAFDLLHFACHGDANSGDILNAELLLEGRVEDGNYVYDELNSSDVAHVANFKGADIRPIVTLNACRAARQGHKLTSIGGFAREFLGVGAGMFVGALWSVGDHPARHFTEELYARLLAGDTLAEATIGARNKAKSAREGTWLAYTVYGNPHARLKTSGNGN